ncbi:MAG: pyroglutamyl-peptidase I [Candidatus Methanomethylicia archaeon]|nr:pyroglutamyl-peptidase I [Candidatus Methanomethylicia archaeon]MDW7988527.1 pyroglutamyl-peptidase I [Nitrososphaerota archaeon]
MVVVLTGFEPYGSEIYNPSGELAKKLNGRIIMGEEIIGRVLPVSYSKVKDLLKDLILNFKPKVLLSLGLAPRTSCIRIERIAINIMDSGPDNDGYNPIDEPIVPGGPAAYFSTLPIKTIVKRLIEFGIPAYVSNSAGTFLCNCVMYLGLHLIKEFNVNCKAGFIHIPYTLEQVSEKLKSERRIEPSPSMNFNDILNAIEIAIEISLSS